MGGSPGGTKTLYLGRLNGAQLAARFSRSPEPHSRTSSPHSEMARGVHMGLQHGPWSSGWASSPPLRTRAPWSARHDRSPYVEAALPPSSPSLVGPCPEAARADRPQGNVPEGHCRQEGEFLSRGNYALLRELSLVTESVSPPPPPLAAGFLGWGLYFLPGSFPVCTLLS